MTTHEYEAYCKAERDRSRARQKVILSFIQKTSTRWPIYFGPETVDKNSCQVAKIPRSLDPEYGDTPGWDWASYSQCESPPKISKGQYLYCKTHDPDRPWPVSEIAMEKLDAMGVRVPKYDVTKANTIERRTFWKGLKKKIPLRVQLKVRWGTGK